jgi:hypothetical protein
MHITVMEICGPSRIYRSDGVKLREAIEQRWSDAEPLEVDFENVTVASISFLDEGIAILALEHPLDVLKRRLKLLNLRDADRRLLNVQLVSRSKQRETGDPGGDAEPRRPTSPG